MARPAFAPAVLRAGFSSAKPLGAPSSMHRAILDDFTYKAVLQSQAVWKSRTSQARHAYLVGDFGSNSVTW